MPGLNRKGPSGKGAMTGRRMGHCNPENKGKTDDEILHDSGSALTLGQGLGRGSGLGRGIGRVQVMGRGPGKGAGRGKGMRNRGNA